MVTIFGIKFKTGKTLQAPENEAVSAYLKAAKDGQKEAEEFFKKSL